MTDKQMLAVRLYDEHKSCRKVAAIMGLDHSSVVRLVQRANKTRTAGKMEIPVGQFITKNTIHYKDGEIVQEWVRVRPEAQMMEDITQGLAERVEGLARVPVRKARKTDGDALLYEIDIFDPHIGMYASERETLGGDYDCDIAAKRMVEAVEELASRARRPRKVVLVLGGDIQHMDNRSGMTEVSRHVLDVDTRYNRVVSYVKHACTDAVYIAASIGAEVEIVITPGNHDWHACIWLGVVLDAYFRNCKNVTVCQQQSDRKYMQWGNCLLAWSHGDKIPSNKWPLIVAAENPVAWGATKHRYLKLGHIHHRKVVAPVVVDEQAGLVVEYLAALCPPDSWHAGAGFVGSQKGASAFEYHSDHGVVTRHYHNV